MEIERENLSLSFDEIYKKYYKKVIRYLVSVAGKKYAEDIAQETFIKIHKKLNQLKDPDKLSFWIYKIALNTARDKMRKESKIKTTPLGREKSDPAGGFENETEEDLIEDKKSYTPEERMIKSEMIECYIDYVKKLSRNYYKIYVLSEFECLTNDEISKRLSLPVGTVKIRLHRARTKLYDELRKNCGCYHNELIELIYEPKS